MESVILEKEDIIFLVNIVDENIDIFMEQLATKTEKKEIPQWQIKRLNKLLEVKDSLILSL